MKKISTIFLVVGIVFLTAQVDRGLAQSNVIQQIPIQKEAIPTQTTFVEMTCPRDGKSFEIEINRDGLQRGTMKVVCPYDGYEFYPGKSAALLKKETGIYDVRCPVDGKIFKAEMDIGSILSGQEGQVLRCPYDGTEFRLSVHQILSEDLRQNFSMTTLKSPMDGRLFRALIGPDTKELHSPFSGETFKPGPEFIEAKPGQMAPRREAVETEVSLPTQRGLSRIETMFVKETPLFVSKEIRQFGYDIFPDQEMVPVPTQKERGDASASTLSRVATQIQQTLLGSESFSQQPGFDAQFNTLDAFSVSSSIPVASDYVLGPQDTLVVSMWGSVQGTFPVTVDRDGKILLPKVGPVYVWGLKFGEAEELIKRSLAEHFSNLNVNVTMGRLRTIRIFVLGELKRPGAYLLNPQSTAFHALYAAGGPTKVGTLRNIRLLREEEGKTVSIDLYKLLLEGKKEGDILLKANDAILVPPIGDVVGIAGSVKRPAIYELMGNISLNQLVEMAGGPTSIGFLQKIQIERIQDREKKVVLDLEFREARELETVGKDIRLQNGDLVLISPIAPGRHHFISITGNVLRPGDYELKGKMTLLDLVEKAGGLKKGTYFDRAEVSRFKADGVREVIPLDLGGAIRGEVSQNIPLEEWDIVTIYSRGDVSPNPLIEITGAVRFPGRYEMTDKMTLRDLLFRSGGLTSNAAPENAELFRLIPGETPKVIPLNLQDLIKGEKEDYFLQEGDRLFVREYASSAIFKTVNVSGEVQYPGEYMIRPGEKLSSLIRRAGGFTERAFLKGAVFTRESVRKQQLEQMQKFLEAQQYALLQEQASLSADYSDDQQTARLEMFKYRDRLLEKLKEAKVMGRMIVHVTEPDQLEASDDDVVLEGGDEIHIPASPSYVQVLGNVYNPSVITYRDGVGLQYYLKRAGGITVSGSKKEVYVIKANGEAKSRFVRLREVERGDTIVVPEAFRYRTPAGSVIRDTVSTLYQVGLGVVAVASID